MFCRAKKPEGYWHGFFDALDVNKDGELSRREFWNWVQMGSSEELIAAITKFNVRLRFRVYSMRHVINHYCHISYTMYRY